MKILHIGSTGLVGGHVLARLLADARVSQVVAPTRVPLPPDPKLLNPIVDFKALPEKDDRWAVDGVICTLGTTRRKARSDEAFRRVDLDYPVQVARIARQHGATRFGLTSAAGADATSRFLYMRTKGEAEEQIARLGYPSLTIVRPGLIGGKREEFRPAEAVSGVILRILGPLLPRRIRINPAERIAAALVDGIMAGEAGTRVISAEQLA